MLYDTIIVGGGPAGLTAAIYSIRAGKSVLLFERAVIGGQVAYTAMVDNYTGIKHIDGATLSSMMLEHAKSLGLEINYAEVIGLKLNEKIKKVITHKGTFEAKTIILCLGASAKKLDIENEKKLLGKGVSYCATCDGNFFKGKNVAVVGGGSTSLEDTIYLSSLAKKVFLIRRRNELNGEKILCEKVLSLSNASKVEIIASSAVEKIIGKDKLEKIVIKNLVDGSLKELDIDGMFIAIGRKPDTEMVFEKLNLDKNGYILTDEKMQTSVPGVYACGDVRAKQLRQIVTAVNDGAIASVNANEYILNEFGG
ncbi:MAG: thioredoxin-disulfide reductase [Clostridia bacterium]|nr:thioredoxin-disulfide reductase [Clostridia bacterium]